jgi:uncharacterized protein YndB with AHSA1/START domain
MTRKHHGRCVTAGITIAAPAREVWRAWADPERIAQWFVDRAEGTCKPGEVMTWIFDAFGYRLPVPILEAEPGARLVTGAAAGVAGPLPVLMELDIETVDGGSRLRLVNSGFSEDPAKDDDVDGVRSGWEMALATLKFWLENHASASRRHHFAMRPRPRSWPASSAGFGGRAGLARYLDDVTAPEELRAGDRVTATLAGRALTGSVLVSTGREVLLEWSELAGVLGLKSFVAGPAHAIAFDLSTWRAEALGDLALDRALDQLVTAAGGS